MQNKAQGLSLTVIIVAAIALLVLVVLSVIFIGKSGWFVDNVDDCQGSCVTQEVCSAQEMSRVTDGDCGDDESLVCCVVVSGEE